MDQAISDELDRLNPATQDAVEVSGIGHAGRGWKSYTRLEYPQFDLCSPPATLDQFDVVLCEQVLEHVTDPMAAARTLRDLAKPGATVVVSTPFLLRIHQSPGDYWRFTPEGLRVLLRDAGLANVQVRSWGNAACVRANFRSWKPYRPWHSLANVDDLPVVVWAFAQRPDDASTGISPRQP
jgi:SAM-dependent methyltransferase